MPSALIARDDASPPVPRTALLHCAAMTEPSDEALMLRYRDGEVAAFELLYARHRGGLYRYLLRQVGTPSLAEELYQDVWARIIQARQRYEPRAKFTTWAYRIAHNRLMDHFRAARIPLADPDAQDLEDLPDESPQAWETLDRERAANAIASAVAQLPAAQRDAFLMQHEGGLSLDDIAQATGASRETVKSRLRYAMARLRERLQALKEER